MALASLSQLAAFFTKNLGEDVVREAKEEARETERERRKRDRGRGYDRHRIIMLAGIPFAAFIGVVITSRFDVFSRDAYDLIGSIFQGDMTRFGDFLGFVAVALCSVVMPIILVLACLYNAVLKPNHVINIDPDRRMVAVDFDLPWMKPYGSIYRFDEIDGIELRQDDEGDEIRLHLPDRKCPLTLISESRFSVAERKFGRLVEIGLPSR